jgi:hypothetical protein
METTGGVNGNGLVWGEPCSRYPYLYTDWKGTRTIFLPLLYQINKIVGWALRNNSEHLLCTDPIDLFACMALCEDTAVLLERSHAYLREVSFAFKPFGMVWGASYGSNKVQDRNLCPITVEISHIVNPYHSARKSIKPPLQFLLCNANTYFKLIILTSNIIMMTIRIIIISNNMRFAH